MKIEEYLTKYGYKGEIKNKILTKSKTEHVALYHRYGSANYISFDNYKEAREYLDHGSDWNELFAIGIIKDGKLEYDNAGNFYLTK